VTEEGFQSAGIVAALNKLAGGTLNAQELEVDLVQLPQMIAMLELLWELEVDMTSPAPVFSASWEGLTVEL
jgi:hypothetical protein